MVLETERLILRPWEESDAESLFEYAKDPRVGPISGWPVHTDIEFSLKVIRTVFTGNTIYAVCLKEDNVAIGCVGLHKPEQAVLEIPETELELGYWIGVPFWGRGIIPEAAKALMKYAFTEMGCTALWCGRYDGNEKSERCQEKLGFKFHHTEYEKPCELGGTRTEHFMYLTKVDWEAMQ